MSSNTSQHDGMSHWWPQRLSSLALVPLSLWFVVSAIGLVGADYGTLKIWISNAGNMLAMVLFIITLFVHSEQGLQVIVEDYVHGTPAKLTALMLIKAYTYVGAIACILSLFHVAFGS